MHNQILECVYTILVLFPMDFVTTDVGTVVLQSGLILSPLLLEGLGSK